MLPTAMHLQPPPWARRNRPRKCWLLTRHCVKRCQEIFCGSKTFSTTSSKTLTTTRRRSKVALIVMWPTVLFALLTVAICGWIFTTFRQTRKVHALERSKEEIQVEETLVFDFLHGLGEAFRETIKPHDLHRLIVEGATRILDAHGGALYLVDRSGNKLVPVFLSNGCPPLVAVPGHILHQSATTPSALEGFLRMHSVPPGEGLIGTVWQTAKPISLAYVRGVTELGRLRARPLGT